MTMINAIEAANLAQVFNRKCWLEDAGRKLSDKIVKVAKTGIREMNVCFKDLVVGAENLNEAAEMLVFFNKILDDANYKHTITPDGTLHITW